VVPLLFRKLAYAVYEFEGFAKVGKLEGPRDVVFFDDAPAIHLLFEGGKLLTLERGHPSTAGNTRLGRKFRHRGTYSITRRWDAQFNSFWAI